MKKLAILSAFVLVLSHSVVAQVQPPAQRAKFIPPVKGVATVDVIQLPSKKVGSEMVTNIKVRNTSKGSINLLKVDEYWYDVNKQIVMNSQYAHRKAPIQPEEIVETTLKSPYSAK